MLAGGFVVPCTAHLRVLSERQAKLQGQAKEASEMVARRWDGDAIP